MKMTRFAPPQIVVFGFAAVILCGALLLHLSISTWSNNTGRFIDSLFTATSATCVTGLTVMDIGTSFSPFGKTVIIFLMQIGGIGIMTFSTLFATLLGRKLAISQNAVVQDALDHHKMEGLRWLVIYICAFTLLIEAGGALVLFLRWLSLGWSWQSAFNRAIFHSVSAFCNAGLGLFPDSLARFRSDWVVVLTIAALIVIGGMGFVVFLDFPKLKFWRKERYLIFSRISLHTKLVLLITSLLVITGAIVIFLLEYSNSLKGMPLNEKLLSSIFTSVTPRTAGFEVVPTGCLRPVTLVFMIILMFIGASPGGTGGGIKTITLGILIASFAAMLNNRDRIEIFGRTISRQTYRKAAVITMLAFMIVVAATFLLTATEHKGHIAGDFLLNVLFESTSAFGTVGLSTGITPHLTVFGKIVIIFTMFVGRVGPLTLALAVAMRKEKRTEYRYPEERLMVG